MSRVECSFYEADELEMSQWKEEGHLARILAGHSRTKKAYHDAIPLAFLKAANKSLVGPRRLDRDRFIAWWQVLMSMRTTDLPGPGWCEKAALLPLEEVDQWFPLSSLEEQSRIVAGLIGELAYWDTHPNGRDGGWGKPSDIQKNAKDRLLRWITSCVYAPDIGRSLRVIASNGIYRPLPPSKNSYWEGIFNILTEQGGKCTAELISVLHEAGRVSHSGFLRSAGARSTLSTSYSEIMERSIKWGQRICALPLLTEEEKIEDTRTWIPLLKIDQGYRLLEMLASKKDDFFGGMNAFRLQRELENIKDDDCEKTQVIENFHQAFSRGVLPEASRAIIAPALLKTGFDSALSLAQILDICSTKDLPTVAREWLHVESRYKVERRAKIKEEIDVLHQKGALSHLLLSNEKSEKLSYPVGFHPSTEWLQREDLARYLVALPGADGKEFRRLNGFFMDPLLSPYAIQQKLEEARSIDPDFFQSCLFMWTKKIAMGSVSVWDRAMATMQAMRENSWQLDEPEKVELLWKSLCSSMLAASQSSLKSHAEGYRLVNLFNELAPCSVLTSPPWEDFLDRETREASASAKEFNSAAWALLGDAFSGVAGYFPKPDGQEYCGPFARRITSAWEEMQMERSTPPSSVSPRHRRF